MPLVFKALGIIGLLLITRAIFVHKEIAKDAWSLVGGICLLAYSIFLHDVIFIVLQIIFIGANAYEIFKIRNSKGKLPIAVSTDEVIRLESGDKDL